MDMGLELISGGLTVIIAALVLKVRQLTPQINSTVQKIELLRGKADTVLKLIENLELLMKDLAAASEDGNLSNEEAKKLLSEGQEILLNPAIQDLKKLVTGDN